MSTLLLEDDFSTLEAALDFIDAFHATSSTSTSSSERAASRDIKRVRNSEAAARAYRKRRGELLRLREQCESLQATLEALSARPASGKRAGALSTEFSDSEKLHARGDAKAYASAVAERKRCDESKTLNRQLRETVKQQRGVVARLADVLLKQFDCESAQELLQRMAVETPQSSIVVKSATPCFSTGRASILQDLSDNLRVFYLEASSFLSARCDSVSESKTRIFQDPKHGPVIEMTSATLLPCNIDPGWEFLMGFYCGSMRAINRELYGYMVHTEPIPGKPISEKEYSLAFEDDEPLETVAVDALAIFGTFESPDCKMFLWAALASTRGDGIQMRERGWTAMTRSRQDPAGRSLYHHHHELFASPLIVHTNGSTQQKARPPLGASSSSLEHATRSRKKRLAECLLAKARSDQDETRAALTHRFGSELAFVDALL